MKHHRLLLGIAAASMLTSGAFAADLPTTPAPMAGGGFNWNSFYLGIYGGAWANTDGSNSGGVFGGVAGVTYRLNDSGVVIGGEIAGDGYTVSGLSTVFGEFYGVGRLGMLANDSTLLYALAGIGMDDGTNAYIVGLGAEYALTDSLTLRGQVYGGADLGATPDYVQGTLGVSWHFN